MPFPVFIRTARALLALGLLVAGWVAALWFLIAPDFSRWSVPQLAVAHVGPPLLMWGGWCLWRRRRQQRKAAHAVRKEELAAQTRLAALEVARVEHAAEQRRLQFGCDCRAIAMTQVLTTTLMDGALLPEAETIHVSTISADELSESSDSNETDDLLSHLYPSVDEALGALYAQCPAAAHFSVYVAPPAEIGGEAVISAVRQIRSRFVADTGASEPILFLPLRDSAAESLIGLFDANPELPGAVVLAFDSPWWRAQRLAESGSQGNEDESAQNEQQRWQGAPGQGVFALFVTHPELGGMLANLTRQHNPHDPMTPYWEKMVGAASIPLALANLSDLEHDQLQRQMPMARIHRPALTTFDAAQSEPSGSMSRQGAAQAIEALIERAQIHAAQIDLSLELPPGEESSEPGQDDTSSPSPAARCDWLVHNVGGVDCGGPRLASLGVALLKRGLDLDPIEAATNVTVNVGDLGQARGVGMLALAVGRAVAGEGAALCAEFVGSDRLSLYFAQAPEAGA